MNWFNHAPPCVRRAIRRGACLALLPFLLEPARAAAPNISLSVPSSVPTNAPFDVTTTATDSDGDLRDMALRYQGVGIVGYWDFMPAGGGSFQERITPLTAPASAGTINLRGEVNDQALNGTTGVWYPITIVTNVAPVPSLSPASTTLFVNQTGTWNFSTTDSNSNLMRWRFRASNNPNAGWTNISGGSQTGTPYSTSFSSSPGYYFMLEVEDTSGASATSPSSPGTITVVAGPSSSAATSITATSFQANWTAATSAVKYRLDVSTSSGFGSFVPGYQDRDVGNVTSFSVTGLTAGTTYYYRVRAENSWGPGNPSSNTSTITVTTIPPAPSAAAASGIGSSGFTANWSSASGATKYRLDVSTSSGFGSYVPGYQNLDVGNVTSFGVTGLLASTTYYYRVRAENAAGASGHSGTITVATTAGSPQSDTNNQNQLNIHIPLVP